MRINRGTLLKIARDTVTQRTRAGHGVLSAYLCGALLGDDYLLGGTVDIDLIFIHLDQVADSREIVRLTDEVHLDIAHHFQKDYSKPRVLRLHPWMGPTIFACKILYDPQHFMDFTQASVRGQFHRPDNVLKRAREPAEHARQIWFSFYKNMPPDPGPEELATYLRAVGHAANAIASLNGPPLTERRLLLTFQQRADAVGAPGLYPGLLGLLGAPNVDAETLRAWLPEWQSSIEAIPLAESPTRLHPNRREYYLRAFKSILDKERPQAVLWPLLRSWTQAACILPVDAPPQAAWREACGHLGLLGSAFSERIAALDAYLDMVEERLDQWAEETWA